MAEVVIIGSGPAGVSAALYTARGGVSTTVLSKGGGALQKTDKIQNYYGFPDVISGEELARQGIEGAKKLGVRFVEAEVVGIGFEEKLVVETADEKYKADFVVIATGVQRKAPYIPGLKELEGKGVSYCAVCDAFFYQGKRVGVLGNGEYALHEAETLMKMADVTIFTNGMPQSCQFPEGLPVVEKKIGRIEGEEHVRAVLLEDGERMELDGLFIAYGTAGSADLAKKIGALEEKGRILVDEEMRTNVPGLYAAGDCNGGMLQIAKAVYEGAVAGSSIAKQAKKP